MAIIDSIVSYYKFDESSGNAIDAHGDNDLTNTNTVTYVAGKLNNGADFEASSFQYFVRTDAAQVGLDFTTDFSINTWIKLESAPATDGSMTIVGKRTGGNGYTVKYLDDTGTKQLGINIQGSFGTINQTLTLATMYMLTFVYTKSAGTCDVYLNGSSIGQITSLSTALAGSTADFTVGQEGADRYLDGMVDEMGLWAKALTAAEVTSLYNVGAAFAYPFPSAPTFTLTETTTLTETINYGIGYTVPLETVSLTESHTEKYGWVNEDKSATATFNNEDKS